MEPSKRMRSATPSSKRSQTARVASGVTSRSAIPVPPVVDYQTGLAGQANDRLLNGRLIVGNDFGRDYRKIPAA